MSVNTELKSCPFCGGEGVKVTSCGLATPNCPRCVEVNEADVFEANFGDGTMMTGLSPKDIYQIGYAAALFGLGAEFTALKKALEENRNG